MNYDEVAGHAEVIVPIAESMLEYAQGWKRMPSPPERRIPVANTYHFHIPTPDDVRTGKFDEEVLFTELVMMCIKALLHYRSAQPVVVPLDREVSGPEMRRLGQLLCKKWEMFMHGNNLIIGEPLVVADLKHYIVNVKRETVYNEVSAES
jgi:hypothetical protein